MLCILGETKSEWLVSIRLLSVLRCDWLEHVSWRVAQSKVNFYLRPEAQTNSAEKVPCHFHCIPWGTERLMWCSRRLSLMDLEHLEGHSGSGWPLGEHKRREMVMVPLGRKMKKHWDKYVKYLTCSCAWTVLYCCQKNGTWSMSAIRNFSIKVPADNSPQECTGPTSVTSDTYFFHCTPSVVVITTLSI